MPGDPALLETLLADRRLRGRAFGAAVVTRDAVRVATTGTRRRGSRTAVRTDDAWHLGSCTKALTAALWARLVEDGVAAWDTPVADLVPDLRGRTAAGWDEPTVTDLLTCRAGVRPDLDRHTMLRALRDERPVPEQRTDAALAALTFPPRERGRFRYSNLGYVVVGAGIERLTGTSWEEALRTHVLEPLGVTGGFGPPPEIWGAPAALRLGPLMVGRGRAVAPGDPRADNPAVYGPAGTLHLSLEEWGRVQRLFQADEHPLLSRESVDRLLTVPKGSPMAMGWAAARVRGVSYAMQGSNTLWAATAVLSDDRRRTVLVTASDGRSRTLTATARVAVDLLRRTV